MQKDRKKIQAQIFDDECICRSFYRSAFGSFCQKRRKEYFFVQTQNVLHIWWYDMLKWAKKTAIFLKISTGKIFSFSIAQRKLEPSLQALKPNTKCINIWKICMMLWMCTYMLEYSPKKTFWHLTVALRVGKMRNSLFKYRVIFDNLY